MTHEPIGTYFQAAATGDAAAWKAFVERASPLVWSVIRAHRLREDDAHEVYQTTWFRMAQHLRRIREPDKAGSWLATTARNECLKIIRVSGRTVPTGDTRLLDAPDPRTPELAVLQREEDSAEAERIRLVWRAFEQLDEKCRRLLRVLMASPPPSYREISAALGMSVGSIGPTRQRCLQRLRTVLAQEGTL